MKLPTRLEIDGGRARGAWEVELDLDFFLLHHSFRYCRLQNLLFAESNSRASLDAIVVKTIFHSSQSVTAASMCYASVNDDVGGEISNWQLKC